MIFQFFLASTILLIYFMYLDSKKPPNFPPGPRWVPIIGNLFSVGRSILKYKNKHVVMDKLAEKYGPVLGLRLGQQKVVLVSDYDSIREVCSRDEFKGRPDGLFVRLRSYGKKLGIAFGDGPDHEELKKFCLKYLRALGFGRERMEELILDETEEIIKAIKETMNVQGFVRIEKFFDVTFLNILWTMVAGRRFDIKDQKLAQLLELIHKLTAKIDSAGGILNQFPIVRYIAPKKSGYTEYVNLINQEQLFLKKSVEEHRRNLSSYPDGTNDLLSAFIRKVASNKENSISPFQSSAFTEEQLLVVLSDFFGAGSDPSISALNFVILYLINFPEYQEKARQQVYSVTGYNRRVTLKDRTSLSYVEAFILEVLRHASNVPLGVAHRATKDCILNGFSVPKDTVVMLNLYTLHRDRGYWGDPEVFRPERFLNDASEIFSHDQRFLPFGGGARRCLGELLAKANLLVFVASLLNNFTISSPAGGTPPPLRAMDGLVLKPLPFNAVFTPNQ